MWRKVSLLLVVLVAIGETQGNVCYCQSPQTKDRQWENGFFFLWSNRIRFISYIIYMKYILYNYIYEIYII